MALVKNEMCVFKIEIGMLIIRGLIRRRTPPLIPPQVEREFESRC